MQMMPTKEELIEVIAKSDFEFCLKELNDNQYYRQVSLEKFQRTFNDEPNDIKKAFLEKAANALQALLDSLPELETDATEYIDALRKYKHLMGMKK